MIWAADKGRAECVRLLLDAEADTEAKDNVRVSVSPRHCAHLIVVAIVVISGCGSVNIEILLAHVIRRAIFVFVPEIQKDID